MPTSSIDFCTWLMPFLDRREARSLTPAETEAIRRKLSDVFLHEIDPIMGNAAHQAILNNIHHGR